MSAAAPLEPAAAPAAPAAPHAEPASRPANGILAARNALKLGGSLIATWCVALVIRFALPRHLGPEIFGTYNLADSLAATYFVLLGLGVETYISKEIALRPAHASDFFGGVLLARAVISVPLFVALALSLERAGALPGTEAVVLAFGLSQLALSVNNSLAALLNAHGTVGQLSVINVAAKVLWGASVGLGLLLGAPLWVLAACSVLSEGLRALLLYPVVRRELKLQLRVDLAVTRRVVVSCLPFFVNGVSVALCQRLDVTMLGFLTRDAQEIGWYSASNNLASLSMLLSPLLSWVVMPLFVRARAASEEEFLRAVRGSIAGVITATLPIMLIIGLGADVFVQLVFGDAFRPAAASLRALVPLFAFTYLAMLLFMSAVAQGRSWMLTTISITGMLLNPLLAALFVPLCARALGAGGAGVGSAIGVVGMEVCVTALLLWTVGRGVLDRPTLRMVGLSLASCGLVIGAHHLLAPLGAWRLGVDGLLYALLVWALGVVRPRELYALALEVVGRRRAAAGGA